MVFERIINNDTWKVIVMAITECAEKVKIAVDDFNAADYKGRLALLKIAFAKAVELASNNKEGNYTCFNGDHEDHTPSMVFDKEGSHFHCFGCMENGKNYDMFNAIEDYFGLEGFRSAYQKAIDIYVDNPDSVVPPEQERPYPLAMYKVMKNTYYSTVSNSYEGLTYLHKRGISNTTAIGIPI